jgi:hypothetical protein
LPPLVVEEGIEEKERIEGDGGESLLIVEEIEDKVFNDCNVM